jgi:hypothetical protein
LRETSTTNRRDGDAPLNNFSAEPEYIREFLDVHKDEDLEVIDEYARQIELAWPVEQSRQSRNAA